MAVAFLSLGCNVGDCYANLAAALERLSGLDGVEVTRVSSVYKTEPVGGVQQPDFRNLAAELSTTLAPRELLAACRCIEEELGGRKDRTPLGPRSIDLDILLYEQVEIEVRDLKIPHPAMLERAFVLVPLAEIAPERKLSGGETVREAALKVADPHAVEKEGPLNFDRRSNT